MRMRGGLWYRRASGANGPSGANLPLPGTSRSSLPAPRALWALTARSAINVKVVKSERCLEFKKRLSGVVPIWPVTVSIDVMTALASAPVKCPKTALMKSRKWRRERPDSWLPALPGPPSG